MYLFIQIRTMPPKINQVIVLLEQSFSWIIPPHFLLLLFPAVSGPVVQPLSAPLLYPPQETHLNQTDGWYRSPLNPEQKKNRDWKIQLWACFKKSECFCEVSFSEPTENPVLVFFNWVSAVSLHKRLMHRNSFNSEAILKTNVHCPEFCPSFYSANDFCFAKIGFVE